MQLGFFASAETTATVLLSKFDFDIIVISANYLDINRTGSFPEQRLTQMQGYHDVESATPVYISSHNWVIVEDDSPHLLPRSANRRAILVVGFNPDAPVWHKDKVFVNDPPDEALDRLKQPDTVLMDTKTRDYFQKRDPGVRTELGMTTVTVVGEFTVGTGYGADGMVLTNERTFTNILGPATKGHPSVGLIKLKPEAHRNPHDVKRALQAHYAEAGNADQIRILTREEMEAKEKRFWVEKTSVGIIFTMGAVVALIVGTVFVYQVISSDITTNFKEFATLRALGYGDRYLTGMVMKQAFVFSVLGYIPGLIVAFILYAIADSFANLPLFMTWERAGAVYLLALLMCMISAYLALSKVRKADPADLF